ncbi:MAG: hypothetical protein JJT96_05515 [Opitutales bacterium]|nr:hypothetical protein [Opitutales bacterium]
MDRENGVFAGVRTVAVALIAIGAWQGAANVGESIFSFEPSYAGHFLGSQLLRPGIAVFLGALLWISAGPLSRRS